MKIKASLRNRTIRTLVASLGLVAAVGVAACATAVDSQQEQAAEQQRAEEQHRFRGPVGVVVDVALAHADLSDAQTADLRDISESMQMDSEEKKLLRDELKASAVDIVRSGTTDSEQFDEAVTKATAAIQRRMLETNDAMKDIHATLDADQRLAVADVLRDRINERFGYAEGEDGEAKRKMTFKRFAKHMALSTLQIDKLKMLRDELKSENDKKRAHPTREELLALVDAFEGNDFGKAVDAFHAEKIEIMRDRFSRAGEHTDTVLSILSEGQRNLLADLIDQGPKKVLLGEDNVSLEQTQ